MIQIGNQSRADGSVISVNDAVIGPIEELTLQIPLKQYESGFIKSHSGVTVRHINAVVPYGGIELKANSEVGIIRDDDSFLGFTEAIFDPIKQIIVINDADLSLTDDEVTKILNLASIRNTMFHEDFGMNVAQGSYDILSGQMVTGWKKYILDGSVLPVKQGKEEKTRFYYTFEDADTPKDSKNQVASHHKLVSALEVKVGNGAVFNVSTGMKRIVFSLPGVDTPEECARYLAEQNEVGTPVSFAWELAEPVVLQFGPRKLKTYHKANTIWNSIGEVF